MNKIRHLDAVIEVFKGTDTIKRGRSVSIVVSVHCDAKRNTYIVQVGSRVVAEGIGDRAAATRAGDAQATRLKTLGKKAVVVVY